jgi:hypothetical protein
MEESPIEKNYLQFINFYAHQILSRDRTIHSSSSNGVSFRTYRVDYRLHPQNIDRPIHHFQKPFLSPDFLEGFLEPIDTWRWFGI